VAREKEALGPHYASQTWIKEKTLLRVFENTFLQDTQNQVAPSAFFLFIKAFFYKDIVEQIYRRLF
jgi:hypothetical protein